MSTWNDLIYFDKTTEFLPMGTFNLIEWKNEKGAMTIQLVGRDYFDLLKEVSYTNTSADNLYNLAADVLSKANVKSYEIDNSLKEIQSNGFPQRIDSRSALQHIGIASRSAVFQDRNGKINIRPFRILDQSDNYLVYCGQPLAFAGVTYPAVNNGFDMKIIDRDNIFKEPEIRIDKAIYEVVVQAYEDGEKKEYIFINSTITGNNGNSFQIDNPLIISEQQARSIAKWIIQESNFNAVYKTNWRQNPALECADMILVEDSFEAKKQTMIVRQEFEYRGFLKGQTESRGGL